MVFSRSRSNIDFLALFELLLLFCCPPTPAKLVVHKSSKPPLKPSLPPFGGATGRLLVGGADVVVARTGGLIKEAPTEGLDTG